MHTYIITDPMLQFYYCIQLIQEFGSGCNYVHPKLTFPVLCYEFLKENKNIILFYFTDAANTSIVRMYYCRKIQKYLYCILAL